MFDKSLIDFILAHLRDDLLQLILHQNKYPDVDIKQAVKCIEGRRKLEKKLASWATFHDVVIPDPVMVEQASSYETALYKTRFVPSSDSIVVDLSGGLGVDSSLFASATKNKVHYLEKAPERVALASHNFSAMRLHNIIPHQGTAEIEGIELIKTLSPDLIFIDPDRRAHSQKRSYFIEDSTPNIVELLPQIQSVSPKSEILIKLSPMIDLTHLRQVLESPCDIHVLSLNRECKELLVHITPHQGKERIEAIELFKDSSLILQGEASRSTPPLCSPIISSYLYDLHPSVAKIGIEHFPTLSVKVHQPHRHTHLYFSEELLEDFPGRKFKVLQSFRWQKSLLKELKGCQFNVIVKNLPMTPEALTKELKIKDGGDLYLICFSCGDKSQRQVIVAERVG